MGNGCCDIVTIFERKETNNYKKRIRWTERETYGSIPLCLMHASVRTMLVTVQGK
jgi:hypothetical protein